MLDAASDHAPLDANVQDLGPLAWVFEELRKSLDAANKAIRRFVRENEQSRQSDLEAVDPASLRMARQQLHQAVGALEVVGLVAPAQVLRAMEAAVQRFVQRPDTCTEDAAAKVERASFALIDYLEAVLNNKPVHPVALFAQYRDVQELVGAERVHPADLWSFDHRGMDVPAPPDVAPLQINPATRSLFDRLVLLVVKAQSPAACQQLAKLSSGLSAGAQDARQITFWRVAAAYFEAVGAQLLTPDVYVKRATSRILLQLSQTASGKTQVSETLLHDLLFFCAQARSDRADQTPHLSAVRAAYGFSANTPAVDYHQATLGRYDPALLAQARKRIHLAKEAWSLFSGGDGSRSRQVSEQFGLIGDSLLKLHPASATLASALVKAADQAVHQAGGVRPELAMEVATTTLYLEAAFEDFDPGDPELAARTQGLAQRLQGVLDGRPPQPLDGWMEQLYRRVSDRQTMGSVVGELKVSLGEVEKSLDQFFRDTQQKDGLHVAVSQLSQMRGVLSVLGLDQAVQAVGRMRTSVEQILDTEVDDLQAREAGTFQQLGDNLSAMSFLVDMLNYQPALAKKLFRFDEQKGELVPLMGRTAGGPQRMQPAQADAQAITQGVQKVVDSVFGGLDDLSGLSEQLGSLAEQASLAEQPAVARAAREAADAVVRDDAQVGAQALVGLTEASANRNPAPVAPPLPETHDDDEDDLLDIFLEEAREVVGNGREAVARLKDDASDLEHLTTLRRAFHTLKGSSRMVGLSEFGEAAWAMEQLLNAVLAEQRPAGEALLGLADEALDQFDRWVQDISAQTDPGWLSLPFRTSAEAMREQGQWLPLSAPGAAPAPAAQADAPAPVADEPVEPADEPVPEALSADPLPVDLPPMEGAAVDAAPVQPDALLDFDFGEGLSLDAGTDNGAAMPAPTPASAVPDWSVSDVQAPPPLLADIDLDLLGAVADAAPVHEPEPEPAPEATSAPVPDLPDVVLDLELGAAPAPEPAVDINAMPEFDDIEDFPREAVESGFADIEAIELKAMPDEPATAEQDTPQVQETPAQDESLDDQTRVIGSLRIGHKLYNVFLNEADEWSRRLGTCLSEWAMETHEPVPDQAEALAHSLAGSSATVGFDSLSGIARALEHALEAVASRQQDGQPASARLARLFVDASEDIRRLLHQFAAGFLKDAQPELMADLHAVVHEPQDWVEATPRSVADDVFIAADAELELLPDDGPEPAVEAAPAAAMPEPVAQPVAVTAAFVPPIVHTEARANTQDIDDDIDAVDTIDVDLFPIFEEEALELLPQLGAALRQWVARPDNAGARAEVLRNLHTIKGSARLAGALRLGEMAHRMETTAERLGSDVQRAADLEPLQSALDAIEARFEQLRHADARIADVLQIAPEGPTAATETVAAAAIAEPTVDAVEPAQPDAVATNVLTASGFVAPVAPVALAVRSGAAVRVRPELLDRLVNQAGEVIITRSRMESELTTLRTSLKDLTGNLDRLRQQLRDIELQAETQMQSRLAQARDADQSFDPLEFDRFTRVQELTRMMAESVNDVATVQRNLQRAVESTEDNLVAQARQTRELQRDLLRTRMVEFEGISERLYRVVRQASKELGKQVRLDITGGNIEMDRGVLDRMTGAFEHLLRNHVAHGIELPEQRVAAGKPPEGQIEIRLAQELNDVSVVFADDGAGLDLERLRAKASAVGLIAPDAQLSDGEAAQLIFESGISTAQVVTEIAGRGIGMDVVRNDVLALGGRIETASGRGKGTQFKLVLPLTTAVTQVVMLRAGDLTFGTPSNLVEIVRRVSPEELQQAYDSGHLRFGNEDVPFFWAGALLQASAQSQETRGRTLPVVVFRSAAQRVAMHVDEVLGNQEVVVKNLGSQLSRLPGLAGMSVLASGAVALIYNPVALGTVYGAQVAQWLAEQQQQQRDAPVDAPVVDTSVSSVPLVLVVDDSITVRRVTQRLLQREGYRVSMAADGLQALERLQAERPAVVLSDIEMPRMDGFDLVRNIRGDVRLADLPVIMITSRIAEKHREHARELGVDHYLGKPYAEDELLALVARYARASVDA